MKRMGILWSAVLCVLLWGSAFPGVKIGYGLFAIDSGNTFQKLMFAGWRFALAGASVLLYAKCRGVPGLRLRRDNVRGVLVMSLLQTGLQYALFYVGLSYTTASKGAMITGSSVFFSVIGAHFLFRNDKLTWVKSAGCVLGFAGVVLVNLTGAAGGGGGFSLRGEGLMALSAMCTGLATPYSKSLTDAGLRPEMITGWQMLLGGGMLLVLGIAGGGWPPQVNAGGLALMAYLVVLSAAAFTVWTRLLERYPSSRVAVYNFLVPVFGTLLSGLLLSEQVLTARNLAALVLVCAGIILINRNTGGRKPEEKTEEDRA